MANHECVSNMMVHSLDQKSGKEPDKVELKLRWDSSVEARRPGPRNIGIDWGKGTNHFRSKCFE
jgi:hypothetical protein